MDEEARAALELTSAELRAMRDAGEPVTLASHAPSRLLTVRWNIESLKIEGLSWGGSSQTAFSVSTPANYEPAQVS